MFLNLKIKAIWPFSKFFNTEKEYEIMPPLTSDQKQLKKELMREALISAIKAKQADEARSIRG